MTLPRPLLDDLARVLAQTAGLSLADGLDQQLSEGLEAASRAAGEPPRTFAGRVLARGAGAIAALVEHAVVAETAFWRHPEQLAAVGRLARDAPPGLSIWSAGCATGEEPYSVALGPVELPLASSLALEWLELGGATLLRRPR